MTEEEAEAGNMKWERGGSVTIRQLRSGNFAMYALGGIGSPFWIGPPSALLEAYADRPPVQQAVYVPREKKASALGIDFNI